MRDLLPWRRPEFERPIESMRSLVESMEKMVGESLLVPGRLLRGLGVSDVKVSMKETPKAYVVTAELPGFHKEELHVDVCENGMTIKAEQSRQTEEKRKHGASRQQSYRSWTQSFSLPSDVKSAEARASFEGDRLTVELPKVKETPVRRVEIE